MTDYKLILKGEISFVGGFVLVFILNFIIPILLEVLTGFFSNNDITGIIWFGCIILYILAMLVVPLMFIYEGVTTNNNESNPMIDILVALLMFIFNMLLTIKGWFLVESLVSLTTDPFITALFWISFIISWISVVVGVPAYIIVNSMGKN